MVWEVETDRAFGVAGSVEDDAGETLLIVLRAGSDGYEFAVVDNAGDDNAGDAD